MGLQQGDAIEIDICSCKDGLIVYHDNDPYGEVGILRNAGAETDRSLVSTNEWRPLQPDIDDPSKRKKDI